MSDEAALDTTILQRANVVLTGDRAGATLMARRLCLLRRISRREIRVIISQRLLHEYSTQITVFHNDFVKAFIELLTTPDGTHIAVNCAYPGTLATG
jgi:CRISPR/Cas system Type II protein with McrA/HNH and RuvC-like nuclease domain